MTPTLSGIKAPDKPGNPGITAGPASNPGAQLTPQLKQTVLDFEKNPMKSTREIRDFSEQFSDEFLPSSIEVLLETADTPGGKYLLKTLLAGGSLVGVICSPFHLGSEQAHFLVERAKRIDPFFEWKLFRHAADEVERGGERDVRTSMRALDLLAITARSAHQIPVVKKLLQHPDTKVRSRAATLMVKVTRETDWVPAALEDPEARVRANALEAFWSGGTSEELQPLLWTALSDRDNRVVGNALLGLYRQGDKRTICLMLEMASDPAERFRATAVWLLGQTVQRDLLPEVQKLVRDPSSMVRRAAVRAARNLNLAPVIEPEPAGDSSGSEGSAEDAEKTVPADEASNAPVKENPAATRLAMLLASKTGATAGPSGSSERGRTVPDRKSSSSRDSGRRDRSGR